MFTLPGKMRLGAFCGHGCFIVGQIVSENIYSYLYTMTMKMTIASVTITHSQISFLLFFSDCFYQVINARNQQENKCICEIQNNVHILPASRHELIIENMKDIINQNMHLYCSHCQAPELEFPECKEK